MSAAHKSLRILIASHFLPRPDHNAADRRFCEILSCLAKSHTVCFFGINHLDSQEEREAAHCLLEGMGVSQIWEGRRLLPRLLLKARFDLLFAEFYHSGEFAIAPFRQANPSAAVIVDSVDLHYVREEAGVRLGLENAQTAASTRKRELAVYGHSDAVINITREDDEIFHRDLPEIPSVLIPIIVPIRQRAKISREPLLFFVGAFAHGPNVDGLLWFVRETWPAIKKQVPETRLEIAGRNPPREITQLAELDGISILGYVPETNPYLDRAKVSIAPLRFGGGMKGKVSEALASGVPVVTTSFGAQGFDAIDRTHFRIADNSNEFASAVVELLQNDGEAYEMGLRGQALVEEVCSPSVVKKGMDEAISIVTQQSRADNPLHRAQFAVGAMMEFGGRFLQRRAQRFMGYRES